MHAPEHQDVRPAVAIEIVDVAEHGIRGRRLGGEFLRRINLVLLGEVRPLVPVRTGDDIHDAVAVDVAETDAVAVIFVGEDVLLEDDGFGGAGGNGGQCC